MAAKRSSFSSRDLITIGVFNALIIVFYLILAGVLNSIPVVNFFFGGIAAAVLAPAYFLMAAKVKKSGVFFLSSGLFGLIMLLLGLWMAVPLILVGGWLGDLLAGRGYRSMARLMVGYLALKVFEMAGFVLVFTVGAERYAERLEGAAREQFMQGISLMTWWLWSALLVIVAVGTLAGGFFAQGLLRKHFEKAGLVVVSS